MIDLRGLAKFSLVDYPGHISCIAFTAGCNLRCPFCHNPCLVLDPASQPRVTEREFFNFLRSRQGLLEGVVISGGEPLLQSETPELIRKVRAMGFLVKLDTNGTFYDRLLALLDGIGVDMLGIDYKTPARRYDELAGPGTLPGLAERVHKSLRLALERGIELDVRTTVHRDLLSFDDLAEMKRELDALGVKRWMLQQFNPVEVIADDLDKQPTYTDGELAAITRRLGPGVGARGLTGLTLS